MGGEASLEGFFIQLGSDENDGGFHAVLRSRLDDAGRFERIVGAIEIGHFRFGNPGETFDA